MDLTQRTLRNAGKGNGPRAEEAEERSKENRPHAEEAGERSEENRPHAEEAGERSEENRPHAEEASQCQSHPFLLIPPGSERLFTRLN
jgi:hypothetical protein